MVLSGRELEVLALVAAGLSRPGNRRPAARELPHRAPPRRQHSPQARPWFSNGGRRRGGSPGLTLRPMTRMGHFVQMAQESDAVLPWCLHDRSHGRRHHTNHIMGSALPPGATHSLPSMTHSCGSANGPASGRTATSCLARHASFTVDIGSGTGLDLPHYPDQLDDLVLAEPDAAVARPTSKESTDRLSTSRQERIVGAPAEPTALRRPDQVPTPSSQPSCCARSVFPMSLSGDPPCCTLTDNFSSSSMSVLNRQS